MWTSHNSLELTFCLDLKSADLEGNLSFLGKMMKFRLQWSVTIFRHTFEKKVMFSLASIMNSPTLLLFQFSPDNCIEHVTNSFLFYDFFLLALCTVFITHSILLVQYMKNAFMFSLYLKLYIPSTIKT